jgi:hypothetical protein
MHGWQGKASVPRRMHTCLLQLSLSLFLSPSLSPILSPSVSLSLVPSSPSTAPQPPQSKNHSSHTRQHLFSQPRLLRPDRHLDRNPRFSRVRHLNQRGDTTARDGFAVELEGVGGGVGGDEKVGAFERLEGEGCAELGGCVCDMRG